MSCIPTRRIILDAPPDDYERCLSFAREAISKGEEGDLWGYWSSADPDFQALIRVNKASVSVRAARKTAAPRPTTDEGETPHGVR